MPPRPSRYAGEFVVKDIANNRQYLADLLWKWDVGDDLTGWTLGGTTVPTIVANGRIDIFDNTAGAATSFAYRQFANSSGRFDVVISFKFTRMNDDTLVNVAFTAQWTPTLNVANGFAFYTAAGTSYIAWRNNNYGGSLNVFASAFAPVIGVEHQCDMILTPTTALIMVDGVLRAEIKRSNKGTAPLSATPEQDMNAVNKIFEIHCGHAAGQVSHFQVRDIKVGRLVGVGDV